MTKRRPFCIIKDCKRRGKFKVRFDIGPTLDDAVVPDHLRIHEKYICAEHHGMFSHALDSLDLKSGDDNGIDATSIRSRRESG